MSRPNSQPAEDDDSINFMESVSSFKSEDFPSSDHEDRKTIGIFFHLNSNSLLFSLPPSSLPISSLAFGFLLSLSFPFFFLSSPSSFLPLLLPPPFFFSFFLLYFFLNLRFFIFYLFWWRSKNTTSKRRKSRAPRLDNFQKERCYR